MLSYIEPASGSVNLSQSVSQLLSVCPAGLSEHLQVLRQRVDVRPERRRVQGGDGPREGRQGQNCRL